MENLIYQLEEQMWQAALNCDKLAFSELVAADAVMVCGGFRCSGSQYAALIENFGISSYQISHIETVCRTTNSVQIHYIIKTMADTPENADLAGLFHITSTWELREDKWVLVFNMDSRIQEK